MIVKVLAIHVDNIRDSQVFTLFPWLAHYYYYGDTDSDGIYFALQYKVSAVTVKIGPHLDELSTVGHVEIDIRHCGWCWFPIECNTNLLRHFKFMKRFQLVAIVRFCIF